MLMLVNRISRNVDDVSQSEQVRKEGRQYAALRRAIEKEKQTALRDGNNLYCL